MPARSQRSRASTPPTTGAAADHARPAGTTNGNSANEGGENGGRRRRRRASVGPPVTRRDVAAAAGKQGGAEAVDDADWSDEYHDQHRKKHHHPHHRTHSTFRSSLLRRTPLGVVTSERLAAVESAHLDENIYVRRHHRHNYTIAECLHSMLALHSETLNVWTHLVGSLLFWYLLPHLLMDGAPIVVVVQCLIDAVGFAISVAAHTLAPHSEWLFRTMFKIDRTAIACVIMAGGVTAGYFSIRCWGESWRWSAVAVNVLVGGLAAWGVFAPSKDTKRRILVAVLFALELAAQFPPVFYEMKRDWDSGGGDGVLGLSPPVAEIVGWAFFAWTFGFLAAVFYPARFPERLWGSDYPGHVLPTGHTFMHIWGVGGVYSFMRAGMLWTQLERDVPCPAM